ncbi:MAG TPA: hypothetical protein VN026_05620 [Bacteroidia bacterium]|nr:hypothetical protein [Bacteroidia bacterium]
MKTMKHEIFSLLSAVIILLSACGNNAGTEIKKITRERDSLIELAIEKDSSIHTFVGSLAEIENNLVHIKQKEDILTVHAKNNVELKGNLKDEINGDIKIINELMDKNSKKIASLNSKLKESNFEVKELGNMVASMGIQLAYKSKDLMTLSKLLLAKNKLIMELGGATFALADQDLNELDTINAQKSKLNKAYYIFANSKELIEKKIVDKEGKFLGLYKEEKLKADFNMDNFRVIDIHQKTILPPGWRLVTKKAKFLTSHPENSYKFLKNDKGMITNIEITDPSNFWKISKFLVVEVD